MGAYRLYLSWFPVVQLVRQIALLIAKKNTFIKKNILLNTFGNFMGDAERPM